MPQAARFLTVPDNVFSIPGMVQGTCITDDGRIVLSVSYGIAPSHLLVYNVNLAAPDGIYGERRPETDRF